MESVEITPWGLPSREQPRLGIPHERQSLTLTRFTTTNTKKSFTSAIGSIKSVIITAIPNEIYEINN